jgi:transposase
MGQPRRAFTWEFKQKAVKLVTGGGHPTAQVARDLGITPNLLRRWKPAHRLASVHKPDAPYSCASWTSPARTEVALFTHRAVRHARSPRMGHVP